MFRIHIILILVNLVKNISHESLVKVMFYKLNIKNIKQSNKYYIKNIKCIMEVKKKEKKPPLLNIQKNLNKECGTYIESRKEGRRLHLLKFLHKECGIENTHLLETYKLERFIGNVIIDDDDIPIIGFDKLIINFRNYLKNEFNFDDDRIKSIDDDNIKKYLGGFPYIEGVSFPYYPKYY